MAPRVRLSNTETNKQQNAITNHCSHHFYLRHDYYVWFAAHAAVSTAMLLPDHNELQQPWTLIYGLLCVCINTPNSWLCGCDSWLGLYLQALIYC